MQSTKIVKLDRPAIWVWLAISFLVIFLPGISRAFDRTENESRLLPRYCRDTMDIGKNYAIKRDYWVGVMGKSFEHMHHYCWAQTNVLRSRKAGLTMQERIYLWGRAVNDYKYVTKNAEPNFILLPEIYTRIGEVEILRGNPADANKAFAQARQLKPDYWPAYSHWAEYLMNHGQRAEALKIVHSGLQQSPDAKVLLELLRILGGKPSGIPSKPVERVQNVVTPPVEEKFAGPGDSESAETDLANKNSSLQSKP